MAGDEAKIDDAVTSDPIGGVVAAALALGVELDVDEARDWMAAVSRQATDPLVVDVNSGVYGHQVTMSDLDPAAVGPAAIDLRMSAKDPVGGEES